MKTELLKFPNGYSETHKNTNFGGSSERSATDTSRMRWFGSEQVRPSNELDLNSLFRELKDEPGFLEDFSEANTEIASALLQESNSLTALRLRAGLSQTQLAEKISSTQPYVARLESGRINDPGINTVTKIAEALSVSIDDIAALFVN